MVWGNRTYALEGIEVLDAVRTNRLDSHQISVHKPPANARCPVFDGDDTIKFDKATVGNPVALWQKATPGGNFLEPAQTSAAELRIVQRSAENLNPEDIRIKRVLLSVERGTHPVKDLN